jgi:hypothetical protein
MKMRKPGSDFDWIALPHEYAVFAWHMVPSPVLDSRPVSGKACPAGRPLSRKTEK